MEIVINKCIKDFYYDFTIGFNVKFYGNVNIDSQFIEFENDTQTFLNTYAKKCFDDLKKLKYGWISDFSFAGRSNGWFLLLCNNNDCTEITEKQISEIEFIVNSYYRNYAKELNDFYATN